MDEERTATPSRIRNKRPEYIWAVHKDGVRYNDKTFNTLDDALRYWNSTTDNSVYITLEHR